MFIFHIFYNIHSYNHINTIHPSPFAEASLHLLIACKLSGKNLPVVLSRESNLGLPYSKPTCYQLSPFVIYPFRRFLSRLLFHFIWELRLPRSQGRILSYLGPIVSYLVLKIFNGSYCILPGNKDYPDHRWLDIKIITVLSCFLYFC